MQTISHSSKYEDLVLYPVIGIPVRELGLPESSSDLEGFIVIRPPTWEFPDYF
jgi:hypothetical protein